MKSRSPFAVGIARERFLGDGRLQNTRRRSHTRHATSVFVIETDGARNFCGQNKIKKLALNVAALDGQVSRSVLTYMARVLRVYYFYITRLQIM